MTDNATQIRLNGEPAHVHAATVQELLRQVGVDPEHRRGIAVALNGSLVPRARWASAPLRAGDELEIISATQGG